MTTRANGSVYERMFACGSHRSTRTLDVAMKHFEEASRPILYEYEHPKLAYWGKGSAFLLGHGRARPFNGLSGSPVYYMKRPIRVSEELTFPMLVGMLIRGTASSRLAHFVGSDVLTNMISLAEPMPDNTIE